MAELNFGLLNPPGSENIANAFVRGQDQARTAQMQDMQMQQATRKGQMEELQYRKTQDAETKLNQWYANIAANGGPKDPIEIEDKMIGSGVPSVANTGIAARIKRLGLEQERQRFAAANAPAAAPGAAAAPVATVNNLSAPQQAIADLNRRIAANIALGTEQGYKAAEKLQKQVDALGKLYTVGNTLMGPEGNVVGTAPEKAPAPPSMVAEYTFAKTPEGGSFRGSFQDFVTARAAAGRAQAQPRPEQPPVAVVDPATGKTVYVSREDAINKRMTPANTVEKPMTEAQRVTYAKDKVSDRNIVNGALAVTGELEKLTDELVGNPDKNIEPALGLNSITGYSALTNLLALPEGDARKALQKLDTFKGKIMALGRQLASQEGKLGNMAVQEWKFVSDAVQKLDPAAGNLDEQMRDVVRQAKAYARRQQTKYDETYADDLTAPPQAAISVTAPNGKTYPFDTPAQAAAFKKAAGIP
jgi:hypothetical protein